MKKKDLSWVNPEIYINQPIQHESVIDRIFLSKSKDLQQLDLPGSLEKRIKMEQKP